MPHKAMEMPRRLDTSNHKGVQRTRRIPSENSCVTCDVGLIIRRHPMGVFGCSGSPADFLRSLPRTGLRAAQTRSRPWLAVKRYPRLTSVPRAGDDPGDRKRYQLQQAPHPFFRSAGHQFPRPANSPKRPLFFFGASSSFFGPGSPELSCRTISLMLRVKRAFGAN